MTLDEHADNGCIDDDLLSGGLDDEATGCAGRGAFKQEPDIDSKQDSEDNKNPGIDPGVIVFQE